MQTGTTLIHARPTPVAATASGDHSGFSPGPEWLYWGADVGPGKESCLTPYSGSRGWTSIRTQKCTATTDFLVTRDTTADAVAVSVLELGVMTDQSALGTHHRVEVFCLIHPEFPQQPGPRLTSPHVRVPGVAHTELYFLHRDAAVGTAMVHCIKFIYHGQKG